MATVVPMTRALSVMTAPLARKNRRALANTTMAMRPCWGSRRPLTLPTASTVTTPASRWGRRAAHSLSPHSWKLAAVIQNDSGGLPQKGTPYWCQGVTQSLSSNILRPISA